MCLDWCLKTVVYIHFERVASSFPRAMHGLRAARLSERVLVTGGSVDGGNSRDEETFRFYQLSDISSCTDPSI